MALRWNHRKRKRHAGGLWRVRCHLHIQQHGSRSWWDVVAALPKRLSRLRYRQVLDAHAPGRGLFWIGHDRRGMRGLCPEGKQRRGLQVLRCRVWLRVLRREHAHAVRQDTDGDHGPAEQLVRYEVRGERLPDVWGPWFALPVQQLELHSKLGC